MPALAQSPPRHDAKEIMPDVYNSTSTTLPAQFGINPISAQTIGKYQAFALTTDLSASSPPTR